MVEPNHAPAPLQLDISVFQHELGVAAGEFHRRADEPFAEPGGELAANLSPAGEYDVIDRGLGELRPGFARRRHRLE